MKDFRLLVCDIDGTIMGSDCIISDRIKNAFRRLEQNGIEVTLATGRNEWEARDIVQDLAITLPVILANGAQIYDFTQETLLFAKQIELAQVQEFLEAYRDLDLRISWFDGLKWGQLPLAHFYREQPRILQRVILDFPPGHYMKSSSGTSFWSFRKGEYRYEITPKSAEKGTGLEEFYKLFDLMASNTVAVGNESNDLSLLEKAGLGLAIGDGAVNLKEKAHGVLAPLEEEPVVALAEWLLGERRWADLVF